MRFTYEDLIRGCKAYVQNEQRDYLYLDATLDIERHWGEPEVFNDTLWRFLKSWNKAFYNRYPITNPGLLPPWIRKHSAKLSDLREKNLIYIDWSGGLFRPDTETLIWGLLDALVGRNSSGVGYSPVAAGKVLNLLAPAMFPLWDQGIKKAYGYSRTGLSGTRDYLPFIGKMQDCCRDLVGQYKAGHGLLNAETAESDLINECLKASGATYHKTLLKLVDEYNYAKFTKHWI